MREARRVQHGARPLRLRAIHGRRRLQQAAHPRVRRLGRPDRRSARAVRLRPALPQRAGQLRVPHGLRGARPDGRARVLRDRQGHATVEGWVRHQRGVRGLAPNYEYYDAALKLAHKRSVAECSGRGVYAPRMPNSGAPPAHAKPRCLCYAGFGGSACERSTAERPTQACLNGCSGRGRCVRNWCHCARATLASTARSAAARRRSPRCHRRLARRRIATRRRRASTYTTCRRASTAGCTRATRAGGRTLTCGARTSSSTGARCAPPTASPTRSRPTTSWCRSGCRARCGR